MSKKNQNYFQALELEGRDNDSDDIDVPARYLATNSKTKPVLQSKKSAKQKFKVFDLHNQFRDRDAHEIQYKIKKVQQINLNNKNPVVLKALANALQKNQTVHTIKMTLSEFLEPFTEEDAAVYRELLSNERINFHVTACCPGLYSQIFIDTGSCCAKNISHLDVTSINTTRLDQLLADLNEEKIVDIRIRRLDRDGASILQNLARFSGFQKLNHLKIQVHDSECDQLLKGLQNIKSLSILDLSESTFTEESTLLLTDLIATQNRLTTLRLAKCKIGENFLSMVCKAVSSNVTIQNLDISDVEPYRYIDLSIVGEITNKKKLKTLASSIFDTIITKIFSVDHLILVGSNYEGLKSSGPEMSKLTLGSCTLFEEFSITSSITPEEIKDLFAALNSNSWIESLVFELPLANFFAAYELMEQLKANRTLKRVEIWHLPTPGPWANFYSTWYKFVQVINTNDTLEEFICHDKIPDPDIGATYSILRALSENTSMTKIGLHPLIGPINRFKEMLTANPRISFIDDSNWPSTRKMKPEDDKIREEVIALNERNKQNAKKRLLRMKMNVATLARSYLSLKVPMEIWKEIFTYVDARMHYFALFNSFLARK